MDAELAGAHAALSPDVRDVAWVSNCAGEIFLATDGMEELRIGHFQGDAALAAFAVTAHNNMLRLRTATKDEQR
ncbi:hypothetical protein [Paraburkholderia sp. A3RO-2L]|uniref:hypothetical protein n=1 Tax=unclassified Paraburkholderia TaxID=2615204 RepID=UPI0032F2D6AD|nr:hypothetical protein [Burkholderia vietnamiensis]